MPAFLFLKWGYFGEGRDLGGERGRMSGYSKRDAQSVDDAWIERQIIRIMNLLHIVKHFVNYALVNVRGMGKLL